MGSQQDFKEIFERTEMTPDGMQIYTLDLIASPVFKKKIGTAPKTLLLRVEMDHEANVTFVVEGTPTQDVGYIGKEIVSAISVSMAEARKNWKLLIVRLIRAWDSLSTPTTSSEEQSV